MDIFQEPRTCREYAIVHELLHLQVPNHGQTLQEPDERLPAGLGSNFGGTQWRCDKKPMNQRVLLNNNIGCYVETIAMSDMVS